MSKRHQKKLKIIIMGRETKKRKTKNGLRVVSAKTYLAREKKEGKLVEYKRPLCLHPACRQGDLDRCPVRCGTCVEAGGFEKVPEEVTYLI